MKKKSLSNELHFNRQGKGLRTPQLLTSSLSEVKVPIIGPTCEVIAVSDTTALNTTMGDNITYCFWKVGGSGTQEVSFS